MNELIHEAAMEKAMENLRELFEPAFERYLDEIEDQLEDDDDDDEVIVRPPAQTEDFKVYDLIRYANKPASASLGMVPTKIWYESAFWSSKSDHNMPPTSKIQAAAKKSGGLTIVDVERWADMKNVRGQGYWRVLPRDVQNYINFLKIFRGAMPENTTMGLYSILPVRNLNDARDDPNSSTYKRWQHWNDEVAPIAEHVDVLTPSLYIFQTLMNDIDTAVRYAKAQISEARRIAPGKKVLPFLWPEFHPGNRGQIGAKYWRTLLDTVREDADGVVIWTLSKTKRIDFSNAGDWWDETERFIASL